MAYVFGITVMFLLVTLVCSSGRVDVLDVKIKSIRDVMEAEIALLRHDMGNVSSQLAHLLNGADGSSKVQHVSQCGCEKAEKGQEASGQFISNQVIRKAFGSEKKLLKTNIEIIHRYVNSTINDVDRMDRSLTLYKVDLSDTKSHVKRIDDITANQSREILAMKGQMDTFMTTTVFGSEKKSMKNEVEMIHRYVNSTINDVDRMDRSLTSYKVDLSYTKSHVLELKGRMDSFMTSKGVESEKKSLKNEVEMIHRYVNSTINDVDRIDRSLNSYKVDLSEMKSRVERIDHITANQGRDILAMKEQMSSFITKFDSLNEAFKSGLEEIKRVISALPGSQASTKKSEADLNKRSTLPKFDAKIITSEADFNERSTLPSFDARIIKTEADLNKRLTAYGLNEGSQVGKHGKSIYVRPLSRANYTSATKICSDIGGYLVEISSEKENAFINQTFLSVINYIYLGGSDRIKEGDWKWAHSGDRIPMRNQTGFQKWSTNQPNNYGSNLHCLIMWSNGEWFNTHCQFTYPYVCEVDLI